MISMAGGMIVDKGQRTNFTEGAYKAKENIRYILEKRFFRNMSLSRIKVRFYTIVWVVFYTEHLKLGTFCIQKESFCIETIVYKKKHKK